MPLSAILQRLFRSRECTMLVALLALCSIILIHPVSRGPFLSASNQQFLFRQIALLAIFAIGETFVIIAGGIDLSVGSLIAFISVLSALCLSNLAWPVWIVVPTVLLAAALVGCYHGFLICQIGMPPFVATLSSMCVLRGLALVITEAVPIPIIHPAFLAIGNGFWLGIPIPVWILVPLVLVSTLILTMTPFGRYLYAVGGSEQATRLSGVNVTAVKYAAYIWSAVTTAIAGIAFAGYSSQGDPSSGGAYELNGIAAAVIGGCSLTGGEGSALGTVIGAAILRVILNGLNLIVRTSTSLWENVVVGTVLVLTVAFNTLVQRRRQ